MTIKTKSLVKVNKNGGVYAVGKAFTTEAKWVLIIQKYREEINQRGKCTTRQLTAICGISQKATRRAIGFSKKSEVSLPKQGTSVHGPGSLIGLSFEQHRFLYDLYIQNPAALAEEYIMKFFREYSLVLSSTFISRWFHTIGPF